MCIIELRFRNASFGGFAEPMRRKREILLAVLAVELLIADKKTRLQIPVLRFSPQFVLRLLLTAKRRKRKSRQENKSIFEFHKCSL